MQCGGQAVTAVNASFLSSFIRHISKFINTNFTPLNLRFLALYGRLVTRTFLVFFNNRRGRGGALF